MVAWLQVEFPLVAGGGRFNSARRHLAEGQLGASSAIKFPIHASGQGLVRQPAAKLAEAGGRRGMF